MKQSLGNDSLDNNAVCDEYLSSNPNVHIKA